MNLGENIYRLRTKHNMSQGDLADALDVSRQSVSKWENQMAVPDLDKLMKMSQLFGVTLDALTGNPPMDMPKETVGTENPEGAARSHSSLPARSGMTPVKYFGGILIICAMLLAILFSTDSKTDDLSTILLLSLPVAMCGILCIAADHPLLPCCWVGCAGYWIYLLLLSRHWEEQTFLLILGVAMVIGTLLFTIGLHRRGVIHVPIWLWVISCIVLALLGLLLLVNTVSLEFSSTTYAVASGT